MSNQAFSEVEIRDLESVEGGAAPAVILTAACAAQPVGCAVAGVLYIGLGLLLAD